MIDITVALKPQVTILRPMPGRTVAGFCQFTGKVEPGSFDVLMVQFRIDSGKWMNASGNETWEISVDTTLLGDGVHEFQARALDANGYSDVATLEFSTANAKQANGELIWGSVAVILLVSLGVVVVIIRRRITKIRR